LTKKDGTTVEFVAVVQVDQYAESDEGDRFGRNLSGSRIPDVFPEELPGMPWIVT
jgi:hypothetical protein